MTQPEVRDTKVPQPEHAPGLDLFASGRAANQVRQGSSGDKGTLCRSRRLLPSGAWQGPKDAADALVEETDLPALGGLQAAIDAGVRLVVASTPGCAAEAAASGLRASLRVAYAAGEDHVARSERLAQVSNLLREGLRLEAVLPTPVGEPMGVDTLAFFAQCRLALPEVPIAADFARLGHRLAQMALGFGASALHGPIVSERALRLGDNANNPALTRKEAAVFIRSAGLVPHERLAGGRLEEITT